MELHPVARRYARALFDAAHAREQLDPVGADLEAVAAFLNTDLEARRLLRSSPISTGERQELAARLFGGRIQPLVLELLQLLLEKKRFELLGEVAADFRERHEREQGIVRIEVLSAVALTEDAARRLERALARKTGRRVKLEPRVEPRLIGGLRVLIGDQVIERSVRRSLEAMRQTLYEAAVHG
jgi:F-type H+-transporting ATPase subunit delta